MRADIERAVKAVRAVYKYESGGGYLHSVIDDGNVDGIPLDIPEKCPWDGRRYSPAKKKRYQECVEALNELSIDGRSYVLAIVHGRRDAWVEDYEREKGCDCGCPNCRDYYTFDEDGL